jgi:hypothetical protein
MANEFYEHEDGEIPGQGQGQISDDVYQKLYQQILPRVQQYH